MMPEVLCWIMAATAVMGRGSSPIKAGGHGVLEGDAELGLAGAHQDLRAVLRRLDDFHIQTRVGKIALG